MRSQETRGGVSIVVSVQDVVTFIQVFVVRLFFIIRASYGSPKTKDK